MNLKIKALVIVIYVYVLNYVLPVISFDSLKLAIEVFLWVGILSHLLDFINIEIIDDEEEE